MLAELQGNPEMQRMLADPQMLQNMMPHVQQAMSNPQQLQQMLASIGGMDGVRSLAANPMFSAQLGQLAGQVLRAHSNQVLRAHSNQVLRAQMIPFCSFSMGYLTQALRAHPT